MIVVSAGIKPRDDLARACGLTVGQRGGVVVDDHLRTSDPDIFAIGEVALYGGMIYGLVAPGYEMAEIAAANLTGQNAHFQGRRHVHQAQADGRGRGQLRRLLRRRQDGPRPSPTRTRSRASYKKLLFNLDGTRLLGGILVGDASEYGTLSMLAKSNAAAADAAQRAAARQERRAPRAGGMVATMPNDAQVCSCNNVSKGADLRRHPRQEPTLGRRGQGLHQGRHRLRRLLAAGHRPVQGRRSRRPARRSTTPCASTSPAPGRSCSRSSRSSSIKIVRRADRARTAEARAARSASRPSPRSWPACGTRTSSITPTIQDTNDRFLANIQRGGLIPWCRACRAARSRRKS